MFNKCHTHTSGRLKIVFSESATRKMFPCSRINSRLNQTQYETIFQEKKKKHIKWNQLRQSQGLHQIGHRIINQQTLTNWKKKKKRLTNGQSRWRTSNSCLFTASSSPPPCEWLCITQEEPPSCCLGHFSFLFFFSLLLLVLLMGFVERKDGLQHEFTKPGIHAGSPLLMDNCGFFFFYLKKKKASQHTLLQMKCSLPEGRMKCVCSRLSREK